MEQGSEQDSPKRAEASKPADGQRASEPQSPEPQGSGNVTANLHGKWDEFVEAVRTIMPSSHFLIAEHATLVSEDATTVTLGFTNQNFVNLFMGRHVGPVAQAIEVVTGVKKTPVAVVGTGNQQAPQTGNQPGHQSVRSNSASGPSVGRHLNRVTVDHTISKHVIAAAKPPTATAAQRATQPTTAKLDRVAHSPTGPRFSRQCHEESEGSRTPNLPEQTSKHSRAVLGNTQTQQC